MPCADDDGPMVHLWSLDDDVVVEPGEDEDELVITGRWGTARIGHPGPIVREALRRMELGPVMLANAGPARTDSDVADVYLVMLPTLSKLSGMVVRTLGLADLKGPLLSVFPVCSNASFALVRMPVGQPVRLPSGVSLTLEKTGFALESADSPHRVVLHRPEAAWVVAMLAWPVTPEAASAALPLPPEVTEGIIGYLAAAGMAAPVGGRPEPGGGARQAADP
ncbi:NADH oxidase [Streptomyces sp. NBC_01754]|uniref:NADH oxidase n=1 Tax=Streptomyces sp. NBC_01754 TaxID=2975930 RepID=UPI002DDAFA8D|nr:NADH oxidase [Streptomyces sp. NBC_01754]WSC95549.1 NADH oxidase [Streptomyces sp. NBC_01754]